MWTAGCVAPVGGGGDAGAAAEAPAGAFAAGGGVGRGLVGRPPGPPAAGGVARSGGAMTSGVPTFSS